MKRYIPFGLFLLSCLIIYISFYGSDSFSKVHELRRSLVIQQDNNIATAKKVRKLGHQIRGLQSDKRALEKAARNELGLAAEDEFVIMFDKKDSSDGRQQ